MKSILKALACFLRVFTSGFRILYSGGFAGFKMEYVQVQQSQK
jgi:hypothetical protein